MLTRAPGRRPLAPAPSSDRAGDEEIIRREGPGDFDAIRGLVEAAFRTAPHADGDEHLYVDRLRASPAYLPELALVLEGGGELLGHLMLTRLAILTQGAARAALLLSPVCVRRQDQGRGLGAWLIREALARAALAGHDAVVLVGSPRYYARFGFRRSTALGIANLDGFDDEVVQALELIPGALAGIRGRVSFPK